MSHEEIKLELADAIEKSQKDKNIDSIITWYRQHKKELNLKNPFDMLDWYYKQ